MVYGFELEIHRLLIETDNPIQVADEILKKWDRGELSWKDQEVASEFLLNAGFTSALFEQVNKQVKARQKIPWACFFEALAVAKARLTKEEVDQILVGAGEEEALALMCRSRALDSSDPRFAKIRANARIERRQIGRKIPPAPPPMSQATMISDRTRPMVENPVKPVRKLTLTEWAKHADETSAGSKLKVARTAQLMVQESQRHPATAYDISISLRFMGLHDEALVALGFAPRNTSVLWLELELLLETGRFVEVLDKADNIERKLTSDPEASFSAAYARAIALHGLGQFAEAKKILEGIVKVKPAYRSAHSLLMKWKGEEK
ncbi:MAG: hypothetical protein ABL958_03245 [Bdellovibrionia bacterium]